jgi:tetratricopeptide (TPR) repeat protein
VHFAAVTITLVALHPLARTAPVHAAEDGGTQSVFATGAGNRALAMGSAFAATADDASAVFWNPAGLGRVQQSEFQASQTGDLGAGLRETYGAVAVPNWRWGTVALTFRQFGVGGIEERDERNVLLDDDLSDSETEVTLGFGRSLHEAWSVGAAAKLQRISLAGYSGSGLGLDLGLLVQPAAALGWRAPWATRWTWGLAIRNAIEPSIRLDRESVADPAAVRTGIAWRLPIGKLESLLAGVDLEKSLDSGASVRAGLEYRFRWLAALRVGVNASRLTAGTGVRWHNISADYAFEDGPVAPAHRVGLSLLFGPTVTDSREAARRKEDEALQKLLGDAFRQRQEAQVRDLLAQAERELAAGDVAAALEVLAVVGTLEPDNPHARTLEAACLVAKAHELEQAEEFAAAALTYERALAIAPGDSIAAQGARRTRTESDRRAARSQTIRERFARAMDAFAAGDLPSARLGFQAVVQNDPSDQEAVRMVRRTEQVMVQRAAHLVEEAQHLVEIGLLAEAEPKLEQARRLDAAPAGLARVQAAIDRARKRARAPAAAIGGQAAPQVQKSAAAAAPAPAGLTDREVESLYNRGLEAMRLKRPGDALHCWELVWSARPGYRQVADYLKREYLTRGMEAFASGYLEQAVGHWKRALEMDPNDVRARGYLERAQQQLARSQEILGVAD